MSKYAAGMQMPVCVQHDTQSHSRRITGRHGGVRHQRQSGVVADEHGSLHRAELAIHGSRNRVCRGCYSRAALAAAMQVFSTNWLMGEAEHALAGGVFSVRSMLSLEPATVTNRRYPELFQTGETAYGKQIVDGQHPHDFVMEAVVLSHYSHRSMRSRRQLGNSMRHPLETLRWVRLPIRTVFQRRKFRRPRSVITCRIRLTSPMKSSPPELRMASFGWKQAAFTDRSRTRIDGPSATAGWIRIPRV